PIIGNLLEFTFVKNKGAAFGILQNQTVFFIIITLMVSVALIYLLISVPGQFYIKLSLSFIFGGALGNLIDRIRLGYVIDFIHISHWPVFNIADMFIVFGSIILAIFIFISEKK
ncbi:MAG: signal peptidase II, partial [Thermoanaerobacteraceae bacterium]|nr:signal peptidase II [Thermoanaerobacteraceae bacterium]